MKKASDKLKPERQKVQLNECSLLVSVGKSKKLAAMRSKIQTAAAAPVVQPANRAMNSDLSREAAAELKIAQRLIDETCAEIMSRFPQGKQRSLFNIRFGSEDALKAMGIQTAFKTLGIDHHRVKMRLIAGLDYYGNKVSG
ncbi:MAG: hypothetical protein EPN89_17435 [Methylovulum sp.]|nr:MAG: hypothetical protein EPN89_17435 [Methylovulum sp.]